MLSIACAAVIAGASLTAELQEIAKLPGEPSIVSAAGINAKDEPILTLENPFAFDPQSRKSRAVIYSDAGSEQSAAVLQLVRWMKTSSPPEIRDKWVVSAMPSADFGADRKSLDRWLTFQAADVIFEVTDAHKTTDDLGRELRNAVQVAPTNLTGHGVIAGRVAREPLTIAKLLAAKFPGEASISYIPAVAWSNTLKLAAMTNEAELRARVEQQIQPWRSGEKELFGNRIQLTSVAGTSIFADLARSDNASRGLAIKGAEAACAIKAGDVYEYGQGWTDDMFMASSVLARTSGLPGRAGDIDVAARMLIAYAGRLQRTDGIFIHATNGPVAWGRGNGFAALGLMEALTAMPERHELRPKILDIFRRQMEAVRAQQAPDGMWREVLDEPGSYREESVTAIVLTAMARGVRLGWLDRSYATVVQRAWRALSAHIARDGTVIDVCTSTGAGPTKKYYLDRAAITGADDRGGAMALMAAIEMMEFAKTGR